MSKSNAQRQNKEPVFSLETVGNFNGTSLVKNTETGFLEGMKDSDTRKRFQILENGGYAVSPGTLFDSSNKLRFLAALKDCWPDISSACKLCNISRETFKNHYAVDEVFRDAVDAFRESKVDGVERVRFEMAQKNHGTLDRMAVLNAYRKEIYNPDVKIQVQHTMTREEATQRDSVTAHSVDAEIVQTYRKVKNKQAKELAKENKERQR